MSIFSYGWLLRIDFLIFPYMVLALLSFCAALVVMGCVRWSIGVGAGGAVVADVGAISSSVVDGEAVLFGGGSAGGCDPCVGCVGGGGISECAGVG